jgi:Na+/H+-dicarboxylate symporter
MNTGATMAAASSPDPNRRLTIRILSGMAAGILCGGAINLMGLLPATAAVGGFLLDHLVNGVFHLLGEAFLRLLQVIVIPLVMASLISGTAALDDVRQLGRIGIKTVLLYMLTTVGAISFALAVGLLLKPGQGFSLEAEADFDGRAAQPLVEVLLGLVPRNIFESMAGGAMIPVIVFSILLGVGITLSDAPGKRMLGVFQDFNAVIMKVVGLVLMLAPYGVFALIARTFANEGFGTFLPLLKFLLVTLGALVFYAFVAYPTLLRLLTGLRPGALLRKAREAQLFAFSTASSNATIPVTLRTLEYKLGVHRSVASFSAPLGATVNMDGTAIMQGIATLFIAQVYGIDLSAAQLLMVVLAATLATIGTAGVPGAGIIMLSMILVQAGLPVAGIGLIMGIDRILDMTRTAVNLSGDLVVGCIVADSENKLDRAVYYDPNAGVGTGVDAALGEPSKSA